MVDLPDFYRLLKTREYLLGMIVSVVLFLKDFSKFTGNFAPPGLG